jgi:NAD+ synthase
MAVATISKDVLKIDCAQQLRLITTQIQRSLALFKRRGIVVALSGGIDSSVTAALCVHALGKERVFGIHMPDRDSSPDTLSLSQSISDHFGFESVIEEITPILEAVGCYGRQEVAIRTDLPEYGPGWKSKIVLENVLTNKGFNYFNLVAQAPDGRMIKKRLSLEAYLGIVAATNFKQRVRKMMEYYHADRLNFAVSGTPNRLEYDQGFFVKLGDGAADIKPIAHLYKSQVYQLAEFLGVPERVRSRPPTTDTYSLPQGQDEFFFSLPYDKLDLCLYAKNHDYPPDAVAPLVGLTPEQTERIYKDIDTKRATTRYLHLKPQLIEPVEELSL